MTITVGAHTRDPLDDILRCIRTKLRIRAREGRCVICGNPMGGDLYTHRFQVCDDCLPPDSNGVIKIAESLGMLRRCPSCGRIIVHEDLHRSRYRDGTHPEPAYPPPRNAYWLLRSLFGEDLTLGR